ncbi:hypothetical protein IIC38_12095 [candidate division KSB1 bacterium]|nr:hypothetical protein [candidate division KSB1 bacterium]
MKISLVNAWIGYEIDAWFNFRMIPLIDNQNYVWLLYGQHTGKDGRS